jgi:hypothetical protein
MAPTSSHPAALEISGTMALGKPRVPLRGGCAPIKTDGAPSEGWPHRSETADRSVRCNAVSLVSGNMKAYYFDNGVESIGERFAVESHEGSLMSRNRPTVVLADRGLPLPVPASTDQRPTKITTAENVYRV